MRMDETDSEIIATNSNLYRKQSDSKFDFGNRYRPLPLHACNENNQNAYELCVRASVFSARE